MKFKCKCGTIVEQIHPDIIPTCNNCGLHLNISKPYIEKSKPITCRSCIYKISSTDLNNKYKKEGLRKFLGGTFNTGLYCLENKNYFCKDPMPLFKGLRHPICEKFKEKIRI